MIAGAGGINSWFVKGVSDMFIQMQVPLFWEFTIFDGDNVEQKNLRYQNYTEEDLLLDKAETLGERYGMNYKVKYIKHPKEFDDFDVVVCGVDNREFREMLFTYMSEHPEKRWIDMRAEGRAVAIYASSPKNDLKTMLATLGDPEANAGPTSCQLEYELSAGIIQLGNRIIAEIGVQYLLNMVRGEQNPAVFMRRF